MDFFEDDMFEEKYLMFISLVVLWFDKFFHILSLLKRLNIELTYKSACKVSLRQLEGSVQIRSSHTQLSFCKYLMPHLFSIFRG